MRGKVVIWVAFSCSRRITPAYAGKSDENIPIGRNRLGSPPPMRGKDLYPA